MQEQHYLGTVTSLILCSSVVLSGGCAVGADPHTAADPSQDRLLLIGEPDFNWYMSGDRRVAPLQVFSDQWRIWLQWHRGQPIPSVLVRDSGQWHVAQLQEHGKFSVIEGNWQQLRFQGGGLRADAQHASRIMASAAGAKAQGARRSYPEEPKTSGAPAALAASLVNEQFEVRLDDRTIRQVLIRWARDQRWTFENNHWAVSVDIPVTAQARFEGDFIAAVRALMQTTDIAGRPLQPCFYSNKVLRVVSASEPCDPSANKAGGAV